MSLHSLEIVLFAIGVGVGYQVLATVAGSRAFTLLFSAHRERELDWMPLMSMGIGVSAHAVSVGILLLIAPEKVRYSILVLIILVGVDFRGSLYFLRSSWKHLALVSLLGIVSFTLILTFHAGAGRGDNLLWSIYKLTAITPGDSPQALLQAQYLYYGDALKEFKDFSIFDRPFLAGLVTLGVLWAVGVDPGPVFNSFSSTVQVSYIALWIWLNAAFSLAVLTLARQFASREAFPIVCLVVLASPFVVFNIIGAWPKLFAAYLLCCAATLVVNDRWKTGVLVAGLSFLTHGSFLWAHLSLSAILILYILIWATGDISRWRKSVSVALIAVSFPVVWFMAEKLLGADTPLKTYYLYNVPVSAGLHSEPEEIARTFYQSTTPVNLAVLPYINLVKSAVPYEFIVWLASFSLSGKEVDWRSVVQTLFYTQFNRLLYSFCLTSSVVIIIGFWRQLGKNWPLCLATIAFILLPLIPGLGLYRRDDHFVTPVLIFGIIPVIIALCAGLSNFPRKALVAVTTCIFVEYGLVYWSRYPSIRYVGEFHEFYSWTTVLLLVLAYAIMVRRAFKPTSRNLYD